MNKEADHVRQQLLSDALHDLRSAIELLDRADAPGNIAGHADLAASQLEKLVPDTERRIVTQADRAWRTDLTS